MKQSPQHPPKKFGMDRSVRIGPLYVQGRIDYVWYSEIRATNKIYAQQKWLHLEPNMKNYEGENHRKKCCTRIVNNLDFFSVCCENVRSRKILQEKM
jgi:hypothetical protein